MSKVTNTFSATIVKTKVRAAIGLYAHTAALKLEAEAKKNAPWWPNGPGGSKTGPPGYRHTGNARNSIQGKFLWVGNDAVIELSGNMEYSVYLELAMGKRYAILLPTVEKNSNDILSGYKKVVG